jgi:hypothetical protein
VAGETIVGRVGIIKISPFEGQKSMRTLKIVGLLVGVIGVTGLLTAAISFLGARNKPIQEIPPQSPVAMSTEPMSPNSRSNNVSNNPSIEFLNNWVNIDSHTQNISRVEIQEKDGGTYINMFGACTPTECNFRDYSPTPTINYNYNPETKILSVEWVMDYVILTQELTITPEGQLKVTTNNHFIDNSGRKDYEMVDYFVGQ